MKRRSVRFGALGVVGLVSVVMAVACGASADVSLDKDGYNVLTTIYPVQYLTSEVAGGLVNVSQVEENLGDAHNFEPTASHILRLSEADAVFYVSEQLDAWLVPFITSLDDGNFVELAEHDEEGKTDDDDEHADEDDGHNHGGVDPHVWLDPIAAIELVRHIEEELAELDAANGAAYSLNADELIVRLNALHDEFETALDANSCALDEVIVNQNFLGHLAARYDFDVHSLTFDFEHDTEIRPNELAEAIGLFETEGFTHILVEADSSLAQVQPLIDEAGATARQIYVLERQTDGVDYFGSMRANLESLRVALQCQQN